MPYFKAKSIRSLKVIDKIKGLEEIKIWAVPIDKKNPDGVRYRLVYIPAGHKTPAVLYDNHHPKGHHKHIGGRQLDYEYSGLENLVRDFEQDIEAFK